MAIPQKSDAPDPATPCHVAVVMDGNGRWAESRGLPRAVGHREGVRALREIVAHCAARGVGVLTAFAFSSENWRRPTQEVGLLMDLFMAALNDEVDALHENNVRLRFVGDRSAFPDSLQQAITASERRTAGNGGLQLVVAANYGGRWDIVNACRTIARRVARAELSPDAIDETLLAQYLSLSDVPEPDLLIRTAGEQRLSNFLLWDCAYTELYFSDMSWPEFDRTEFDRALTWYAGRERRFGRIAGQTGAVPGVDES